MNLAYRDSERLCTGGTIMTLVEFLYIIDPVQAKRFTRLNGSSAKIAAEGIIRHVKACKHLQINPDISAIREIIDDAAFGRQVYMETDNDCGIIT